VSPGGAVPVRPDRGRSRQWRAAESAAPADVSSGRAPWHGATIDLDGVTAVAVDVPVDVGRATALAKVLGADPPGPAGVAHPLLCAAIEWTAPLAWPATWPDAWARWGDRVVHGWHEIQLHRPLRCPSCVRLEARVAGQRTSSTGAVVVVDYAASDAQGPVWATRAGMIWRGIGTRDCGLPDPPMLPTTTRAASIEIPVAAGFAGDYSSATGIWNPIHTDGDVARAAGLPAPPVHGTAVLGLAVTELARTVGVRLDLLRSVAARFTAPVYAPSTLGVAWRAGHDRIDFRVDGPAGTVLVGRFEPAEEG